MSHYRYTLESLPYDYDALSPSISAEVMKLHHTKHHQTYVDKLNEALDSHGELQGMALEDILAQLNELPTDIQTAIRNNGGGHYNHSLFWQWMSPSGGGEPRGELARRINERYGGFQQSVDEFSAQATGLFGSGWVWLQPDGDIITTENQDTPLMHGYAAPLLGLDVWEHAYYLDYKNVRADYIRSWWDVVNWEYVTSRLNG